MEAPVTTTAPRTSTIAAVVDTSARLRRIAAPLAAAALLALGAMHARAEADDRAVLVLPAPDAPIAVPAFAFDDNPDPDQCGIPQPMGSGYSGTLHGTVDGALVEPRVYLYDSHLRSAVRGTLRAGSVVEVVMYQSNPVLDFFFVRFRGDDGRSVEGWVPAPLIDVHPRHSGG